MSEALLRVEGLTKHFPVTRGVFGRVVGQVRAVDGVSFEIAPGETLGLVGESGCGKTTAGRCVLRLIEPTSGRVTFDGHDVTRATQSELTKLRRHMQIVFQDPYSSLNPRMRVVDLIGEALEIHGLARGEDVERRVGDLLRRVGLSPSWINRYPHEFSGGQRQRIGVARAIALEPKLIVCDEAVSALDVSIQAQVVNLLIDLRRDMSLSYLFIAHDLSVVRHVSHRIAVMYLGQIVELGPAKRLFQAPAHPYTRALLSAIPVPDPEKRARRLVLTGDVPTPLDPPSGCRFHTRCPAVRYECRHESPPVVDVEPGHSVACVHARGLEGDPDWHRVLSERIDRASAENSTRSDVSEEPDAKSLLAIEPVEAPEPTVEDGQATATVARPLGILAFLAGAALIAFGAPVWGALLAWGAHGMLIRPRAISRRRTDAVALLVVIGAFALSFPLDRRRRREHATYELRALSAEIESQRRITGALPSSLADLGFRLFPFFEGGRPNDPWGRPFRYRAGEGNGFELGSTGPDGVPSSDDVGQVPRDGS